MSERLGDAAAAQQIELFIHQLEGLSILPVSAAQFLKVSVVSPLSGSALAEIIEADPALTAKIISLSYQKGVDLSEENFSIAKLLEKIPENLIREAFFSLNILETKAKDKEADVIEMSRGIVLHSVTAACCAKAIAEVVSPRIEPQMAYLAGLMHDIGKLFIAQQMPKSFVRIVEEAKSQNASSCDIERKYLGIDHAVISKRLAQRWHLGEEITNAVWLGHIDSDSLPKDTAESRLALLVQLADLTARQAGIGYSGSYNPTDSVDKIVALLEIDPQQMERIRHNLSNEVSRKIKPAGLDSESQINYSGILLDAAAQLSRENARLSAEQSRLQSAANYFDFATEFLSAIDSAAGAIDIAKQFAIRWQKFYQTGNVCLYLAPASQSRLIEAVIVENQQEKKMVLLNAPAEVPVIPTAINKFAVAGIGEESDWLFEQLETEFELSQTKIVPLLFGNKAIGVIVFEFRQPVELNRMFENFRTTASLAGTVLGITLGLQKQQEFAEHFARPIVAQKITPPQPVQKQAVIEQRDITENHIETLAEMAAGAAHELNNPLAVISGRAQLLSQAETDPEKKRILEQIQENAAAISQIADGLLGFAEPPAPRPTNTDISQIIDEAVQLAMQKTKREHINIQTEISPDCQECFRGFSTDSIGVSERVFQFGGIIQRYSRPDKGYGTNG